MESAGTGTKHLGSKSARLGLDITKTRVVTLLLRVELVKYARKNCYAKKSDNRERQSQTLFSITSTRLHEVSSH